MTNIVELFMEGNSRETIVGEWNRNMVKAHTKVNGCSNLGIAEDFGKYFCMTCDVEILKKDSHEVDDVIRAEIKRLKETNMSLCRDLDEAQRAYENAVGIGDQSG